MSARAAEERFRGLVESIEAVPYISAWDAPGTIRYMSPHAEELLGYPREQWYHGPDPWSANLHPDDRERVLAESERTFAEGRDFACEYRMLTADGRVVWIAERETIVRDDGRRAAVLPRRDVRHHPPEDRRAAARDRRGRAARGARPGPALPRRRPHDAARDRRRRVGAPAQPARPRAARLPGRRADRAQLVRRRRARRRCARSTAPASAGRWRGVPSSRPRSARRCSSPPPASCAPWPGATRCCTRPTARPSGTLSSGEDITDQLRAEAEIRRLAYHDHLTGLPNRSHFDAELHAAVATAADAGHAVALLFADLDGFKRVNDSLGHAVGDELLRGVAARLVRARGRRAARPPRRRRVPRAARRAAARPRRRGRRGRRGRRRDRRAARRAVRARRRRGADRAPASAAPCSPSTRADADALLRHADAAMYRAKRRSSPPVAGR